MSLAFVGTVLSLRRHPGDSRTDSRWLTGTLLATSLGTGAVLAAALSTGALLGSLIAIGLVAVAVAVIAMLALPALTTTAWTAAGPIAGAVLFLSVPSHGRSVLALALIAGLATTGVVRKRAAFLHLAAGAGAALTPVIVVGFGGSLLVALVGLVVAAAIATAVTFRSTRFTALDTVALAAAVVGLLTALYVDDWGWTSMAAIVLGSEVLLYGIARREQWLQVSGGAVAALGIGSLPFSSGMVDRVFAALAPYNVTMADINVTLIVVALFIAGALVRRKVEASSWLAYGAALTTMTVHLLATLVDTHDTSRAGVAIACSVLAVAFGGMRRLAAPMFVGIGLLISALLIELGPNLARLSVWAWVAAGGVALIGVAIAIERAVRGGEQAAVRRIWQVLT
jgi:hypothetical protein